MLGHNKVRWKVIYCNYSVILTKRKANIPTKLLRTLLNVKRVNIFLPIWLILWMILPVNAGNVSLMIDSLHSLKFILNLTSFIGLIIVNYRKFNIFLILLFWNLFGPKSDNKKYRIINSSSLYFKSAIFMI